MGGVLDTVHGGLVHERRVRVLARHLADLVPNAARVVDVGCGDGRIDALIQEHRPDLEITGMDIGVRDETLIPVQEFDGLHIPLEDGAVDVVMLVDVLHHADDPHTLLAEAKRVAGRAIVLKDVTPLGPGSDATLRFMDWVGNARHGVPLPYDFWTQQQWRDAFAQLGVRPEAVTRRLGLYPWPASLLFEKRMHFVLRLVPRSGEPAHAR
ncbi:MAG: methyltransferase domain-containing protein [Thermoleophilaceae bacterium]